ncbi:fibronectin type III domain-containing protein [Geobacter sp. SVR]|uniref:fibronectin type III domain-containing protein n=1 Tax=Geobacter sp. SVR TaxID=2495594 RepID=UPI00143EFA01|nr:fibronectin type III domain-containing protein [Geobacter sp. SVR]BCS53250.1 hypothetical protein GSVR_15580 [Geobacter sp. SVR]GCF84636.1 hypothetical protein GSbR_12360 [Geobacter sp. SVR]
MTRRTVFRLAAGYIIGGALLIAGCGGSGTAGSPKVTGTASEGALIKGKTVQLRDAENKTAPAATTDAATGVYSIDVSGLKAPFLVTVTGTNGTYVSLAPTAGTANINPVTTAVVALAAGNPDPEALFSGLNAQKLSDINATYAAQAAKVTTALAAILPAGASASDFFTGTITAGKGIDAVFDSYTISVRPDSGITVSNRDAIPVTLLSVAAASVSPSAVLTGIPNAPATPAGVSATAEENAVHLSWGAVSGATSYNIYWSTTSGVTKSTGTKIAAVDDHHYMHTGLNAGSTYYYIVTAVNSTGESAASSQVSASTPAAVPTVPAIPAGVSASRGINQTTITWSPVSGATSYNIYWTNDPTHVMKEMGAAKIAGVTSPYRHTNLTAGLPYAYVVTAVNSIGESGESEIASATTSTVDGLALYSAKCASCHNPLAISEKKGRTATQIQAAITANKGGMGSLSTLAAEQVQAIAEVLGF